MKSCSRCKKLKSEVDFHKCKGRKDGLSPACKQCENARKKKWALENPEAVKEKHRRYHAKHKERIRERGRERYHRDIQKSRESCRQSYWKHRDEILERRKKARDNDEWRTKEVDRQKKWRQANREKFNETFRQWRFKNKQKVAANQAIRDAVRRNKIIRPSQCELCGKNEATQAHHKDYSKKLDVIWVCRVCHCTLHGKKARTDI